MKFTYQPEKKITEFTTEELRAELDKRRVNEEIRKILESGEVSNVSITKAYHGGVSVSFDVNGGA